MQRGKTSKKVEELSRRRRRCLLLISPFSSLPTLRESRCIIHDFVNVACRCIFTALYLEKFRAGETRYTAASARGVWRGTRVFCVSTTGRASLSNSIRYWIGCPTCEDRKGWNKSYVSLLILYGYAKKNYEPHN